MTTKTTITVVGMIGIAIFQTSACEKKEAGTEYILAPVDSDTIEQTDPITTSTEEPGKGPETDSDSQQFHDDPETCADSNFKIEGQIVDMLIVLDRSNSMKQDGLWGPMGNALGEVTAQMAEQINFGLLAFPAQSCNGLNLSTQCATPTNVRVGVGHPDAASEIAAAVSAGGVGTCGGTPTANTLTVALDYLGTVNDDNRRYVLLATDGAPNCNPSLHCDTCTSTHPFGTCANSGQCLDDSATISASKALFDAGYPVYVLGMGGSTKWSSIMNSIAQAGGTGAYYAVNKTSELLATLENIAGAVVSCQFDVDWDDLPPQASADPSKVNFYCKQAEDEQATEDNLVGYDQDCQDGSGWNWIDNDTVEFCAAACEKLKKRSCPVVTATFGCISIPVQ